MVLFKPALSQVAISVSFGPPALPVYEQPPCPEDGWIWVPGYWAWDADDEDYYWVPGTWVAAPETGYLWTPAWWGWENGAFLFHDGYWATDVGFYGGVNYGFGYFGHGFEGGRWDHDHFFYNTAVVRVNERVIRNVYVDRTVMVNNNENHVSYNGGEGGVVARPTERESAVEHARHIPPPAAQEQRRETARSNPQMRASANQGRPPVAATARPGETSGVAAKSAGAPYHPPANRQGGQNARPGNENAKPGNESQPGVNNTAAGHARELQPHQAPAPPEGNSAADQKYQQQQQKLVQKQNQEHQKLAQQQEQEDQRAQQQHSNQQKQQQIEQKHQQQTQQLEQRHQQQQQKVEQQKPQPKPQPKPKEHPQN
jgi:hypothetical protein